MITSAFDRSNPRSFNTLNILKAAARGAQIICLQELFAGEYFCRVEDAELFNLAEAVPGPTTDRLAKVAKEKKAAKPKAAAKTAKPKAAKAKTAKA